MSDKKDVANVVLKFILEGLYHIHGYQYSKAYLEGGLGILSILKEDNDVEKNFCEELETIYKDATVFLDELDAQKRFDNAVTTN